MALEFAELAFREYLGSKPLPAICGSASTITCIWVKGYTFAPSAAIIGERDITTYPATLTDINFDVDEAFLVRHR